MLDTTLSFGSMASLSFAPYQYIKNLVPFLYCFQLIIFKYIVTTHLFILNSLFFVVFIQLTIIHMWFTKKKENYTQPLFQLEISRLIKKKSEIFT